MKLTQVDLSDADSPRSVSAPGREHLRCFPVATLRIERGDRTGVETLPRFPTVPIVRIDRLAVDFGFQGRKLDSARLFDAIERSIDADIACFSAVVDAENDGAVRFYERHGFLKPASKADVLFLPLSDTLKRLAKAALDASLATGRLSLSEPRPLTGQRLSDATQTH